MRKRSRLLSVAFTQLALVMALFTVPAAGQVPPPSSPTTVLNWIPPLSSSLASSTVCDFFTLTVTKPPTTCPTTSITGAKTVTGIIPMWLGSDTVDSNIYNFALVGTDPTAKNGAAVTITTRIIPLRVSSSSPAALFDPENNDSCSPSKIPALNMVQNSPMFLHMSSATLPSQLKPLGPGQYASLFQRASFWTYINPKATSPKPINPNYQVDFLAVLSNAEERDATTIQMIDPGTAIDSTLPYQINGIVQPKQTGWCSQIGVIEVNQLDALLQNTIIPKLKAAGISPTNLPIFLLSNVAMYDSTLAGQPCCILGYHNAYKSITTGATANKLQTYIVVNYDSTAGMLNTGAFPGAPDIAALSTVLPGWIDDPTTLNVTPNWLGTINAATQCQTALEVGFPAGLPLQPITMPSRVTYHVQDLAFKSWYYRDGVLLYTTTSNSGLGGNYSLFGTFTSAALPCP
jgi:hypothetical protein